MGSFQADRPLRVAHVVAGLDSSYGGPSYTVPRLCRALGGAGIDLELLSVLGKEASPPPCDRPLFAERRFQQDFASYPILGSLRMSSSLNAALRALARDVEIIHNHGLWLMPNLQAWSSARREGKPLIVAPRGMLAPKALAFSSNRKKLFWLAGQRAAVRSASCLHATSEQEYQDIRALGLTNPVAIVPNGIDLPEPPRMASKARSSRTALYLGRIHPIKGLDRLLSGWAAVESRNPEWRLRVIGPAEGGHDLELRRQALALGLQRLFIEGPLYGDEKRQALSEAEVFVMPSLNESFAVSVGEALASGLAVIATKATPWRGLLEERCGWWVEGDAQSLAAAMQEAMSLPSQALAQMGARGRSYIARDFSWERVAAEMRTVYSWISRGAEKPPCVR